MNQELEETTERLDQPGKVARLVETIKANKGVIIKVGVIVLGAAVGVAVTAAVIRARQQQEEIPLEELDLYSDADEELSEE